MLNRQYPEYLPDFQLDKPLATKDLPLADVPNNNFHSPDNALWTNKKECEHCHQLFEQNQSTLYTLVAFILTLSIVLGLFIVWEKIFPTIAKKKMPFKPSDKDLQQQENKASSRKKIAVIKKDKIKAPLTEHDEVLLQLINRQILDSEITRQSENTSQASTAKSIHMRKGLRITQQKTSKVKTQSVKTDLTQSKSIAKSNDDRMFEIHKNPGTYVYINLQLIASLNEIQQKKLKNSCENERFFIREEDNTIKVKMDGEDLRAFGKKFNKSLYEINILKFKHDSRRVIPFESELKLKKAFIKR